MSGAIAMVPFIRRVQLRNFKSIAECDVSLGALTFLVGPNGSGKSNFLDSLRFVSDALSRSLDQAIRERGGISDVRRRSSGHPTHFGTRVGFQLDDAHGHYAFEIGARKNGGYSVTRETCRIERTDLSVAGFDVHEGDVADFGPGQAPAASSDRLFLVNASGLPAFRPLYDGLSRMAFYSLDPNAMRRLQPADAGDVLRADGGNVASVLQRLATEAPETTARIEEYLSHVVPGITGVEHKTLGPMETLEFRQEVAGAHNPWRFLAANISDGTVRALGILVALFQAAGGQRPVPLVGIEEPEIALHPAAAGVLTDCLRDASATTQVLVTSHSAELLDDDDLLEDSLLAAVAERNETHIGRLDEAGRSALRDHLFTAGDLLRMDHLRPAVEPTRVRQLDLFEHDT